MTEATRNELKALLTRAAIVEGERQAARQRGEAAKVAACERELAALWRQYADLEAHAA